MPDVLISEAKAMLDSRIWSLALHLETYHNFTIYF